MERFAVSLLLLSAGLLAIPLTLAPVGFALAQDANDADLAEQTAVKVPNLSGCWQGNAFNNFQGNTGILFFFAQTKNKISKKHSTFALQGGVELHGPIAGTVKATKFTFQGPVTGSGFNPCMIKGTGFFQSDDSIEGHYRFSGKCFEHQFTTGTFSKVMFLGATCP